MHDMELPNKRASIIRAYIAAYNRFDVEGMVALLHPEVVFENVAAGQTTLRLEGIGAFRQQAEAAARLFTAREQQVTHLAFDGDTAEAAIHYRGTLAADLPGGPRQGETIELDGRSVFQFRGDRIARLTDIS